MLIHSLPQGGALGANIAASPVTKLIYAALSGHYRRDELKMPMLLKTVGSDTHSYKDICAVF